jgi:ubiquinone/menaquinone biosynthesis C-methylase UbiE
VGDPRFRPDLFRGTARAYDQFRLPYPDALIDTLARCCPAAGTGTMLDLACGTGQLGFALRGRFREVWAADLEPDMIALVRAKALAAGLGSVRPVLSAAEDLIAPTGSFLLVTIGNAFHRMQREAVAANVFRWLRPGGWLALVWGGSPWDGDQAWQAALRAFMARWQERAAARSGDRIPAGYEQARQARPDPEILRAAGFEIAPAKTYRQAHEWTPDSIAGYLASTSVLSAAALGELGQAFDADLRRVLAPWSDPGGLRQEVRFECELARRPSAGVSACRGAGTQSSR